MSNQVCQNCDAVLKADEVDYCRECYDPDAPKPSREEVIQNLREHGFLEEN